MTNRYNRTRVERLDGKVDAARREVEAAEGGKASARKLRELRAKLARLQRSRDEAARRLK